MEKEIWKKIDGFENYEISNFGKVKSNYGKGRILKTRISDGYELVNLNNKTFKVHRLLAIAFIPNIFNKPAINHINKIRNDNRIENLEWVTISENNNHRFNKPNLKKFTELITNKINEIVKFRQK